MSVKYLNQTVQQTFYGNVAKRDMLSRVIVDKERKLLYNRIRKNANSFVSSFLFNVLSKEHGSVDFDRSWRVAKREAPNLSNTLVFSNLAQFRSLLVVRHPFSRTLSAFLQKFGTQRYRDRHGDFELSPSGFAAFVDWLDEGGLALNSHWDLQSREMAFQFPFYSDVVKFEELGARLTQILGDFGYDTTLLANESFVANATKHKTRSDEQIRTFVDAALRRKLARIYAADLEMFSGLYQEDD